MNRNENQATNAVSSTPLLEECLCCGSKGELNFCIPNGKGGFIAQIECVNEECDWFERETADTEAEAVELVSAMWDGIPSNAGHDGRGD